MRALALALLLVLPLAGCARGRGDDGGVATAATGNAQPSATAQASHDPKDEQEQMLKYAQCMRDHGVAMDDPQMEGGGININIPEGVDKSKVDAANAACKQYMPNGGEPPKMDPAQQEQLRKLAQCMRDHGIVNFPDPSEDGGLMIDSDKLGVDPQGQQFKDAQQACEQYGPKPPDGGGGGSQTQTGGKAGGSA